MHWTVFPGPSTTLESWVCRASAIAEKVLIRIRHLKEYIAWDGGDGGIRDVKGRARSRCVADGE